METVAMVQVQVHLRLDGEIRVHVLEFGRMQVRKRHERKRIKMSLSIWPEQLGVWRWL